MLWSSLGREFGLPRRVGSSSTLMIVGFAFSIAILVVLYSNSGVGLVGVKVGRQWFLQTQDSPLKIRRYGPLTPTRFLIDKRTPTPR